MESYKQCPECGTKFTLPTVSCACGHVFRDDDIVQRKPEERITLKIAKGVFFMLFNLIR
jgi:hypothetical protein